MDVFRLYKSTEWTAIKVQVSILAFQLPRKQIKTRNLHKIYMLGRGMLNTHFCKKVAIDKRLLIANMR